MSLKSEVFGLLDDAQQLCRQCPDAGALLDSLREMRARLETPLRVAVVGIMKAGKSTFMNALMGYSVYWRFGDDLHRLLVPLWRTAQAYHLLPEWRDAGGPYYGPRALVCAGLREGKSPHQ